MAKTDKMLKKLIQEAINNGEHEKAKQLIDVMNSKSSTKVETAEKPKQNSLVNKPKRSKTMTIISIITIKSN